MVWYGFKIENAGPNRHGDTMTAMAEKPRPAGALSRDDWLRAALALLGETGDPAGIRIDELCRRLNVTKGSFYWHFKGRAGLMDALAEFWERRHHEQIHEALGVMPERDPHGFLQAVIAFWSETGFSEIDAAMRRWAASDAKVARAIKSADMMICDQFQAMFETLGLPEQEAHQRALMLIALGIAAPQISHLINADQNFDQVLTILLPRS